MYQCRVVFTVGLFLQITQYGSISAVGSSSLPHMSHWSPRAFSQPQYGHLPSTKRSGKKPLVMLAVEHLGFLLEDVAVFLDFKQGFLDKLLVHWAFGACVIVK